MHNIPNGLTATLLISLQSDDFCSGTFPFLSAAFFSPRPAVLHCPFLCRRRPTPLRLPPPQPLPQPLLLPSQREFPRKPPKLPRTLLRRLLRTRSLSPSPMVGQMSQTRSWRPPPAEAASPFLFCPSLESLASPRWLSRDERTLRTPDLTRIRNHRTARSHRRLEIVYFYEVDEGICSNGIKC